MLACRWIDIIRALIPVCSFICFSFSPTLAFDWLLSIQELIQRRRGEMERMCLTASKQVTGFLLLVHIWNNLLKSNFEFNYDFTLQDKLSARVRIVFVSSIPRSMLRAVCLAMATIITPTWLVFLHGVDIHWTMFKLSVRSGWPRNIRKYYNLCYF